MSKNIEIRTKNQPFNLLRSGKFLLIPREYIKMGDGYNIDYETPALLCCLPQSRHREHQIALLDFAQTIYANCEIPKYIYLQQWSEILKNHTHGLKRLSLIHYGLTFQNRAQWGDLEPQPVIRYVPYTKILSDIFSSETIHSSIPNSSFPKQP